MEMCGVILKVSFRLVIAALAWCVLLPPVSAEQGGESVTGLPQSFTLKARDLSMVNEKGEHVVAPGEYTLFVGGALPGETPGGVRAKVEITGQVELLR